MSKILVIDTGVILHAKHLFWNRDARFITVPGVLEEVNDKKSRLFLDQLLAQRSLEVISPTSSVVSFVRKEARDYLGETKQLSRIDINLVTLAFELYKDGKCVLLCSNDLSIQNLANHMGIEFWGEKRIKSQIKWIYRCRGCGIAYTNKKLEEFNLKNCDICGSELRKYPNKSIPVSKDGITPFRNEKSSSNFDKKKISNNTQNQSYKQS